MLGCFLAKELQMRQVVIPTTPGVTSALGGLVADIRNDFVKTVFAAAEDAIGTIPGDFEELSARALDWLHGEQHHAGTHTLHPSADMRYTGQSFEIEVPLKPDWLVTGNLAAILDAFHRRHDEVYAFNDADAEVQIMNLRLVVAGTIEKPTLKALPHADGPADPVRDIEVWFDGKPVAVPLYERDRLCAGQTLDGPSVIAQSDTTSCIPDGFAGTVDVRGSIMLERREES